MTSAAAPEPHAMIHRFSHSNGRPRGAALTWLAIAALLTFVVAFALAREENEASGRAAAADARPGAATADGGEPDTAAKLTSSRLEAVVVIPDLRPEPRPPRPRRAARPSPAPAPAAPAERPSAPAPEAVAAPAPAPVQAAPPAPAPEPAPAPPAPAPEPETFDSSGEEFDSEG